MQNKLQKQNKLQNALGVFGAGKDLLVEVHVSGGGLLQVLGFKVGGSGFRFEGLGFRVQGSGVGG